MQNKYGLPKDIAEDIELGDIQKALEKVSKRIDDFIEQNMNKKLSESIEYPDPFRSVWYVRDLVSAAHGFAGFKLGQLNSISVELEKLEREPVERTISDIKKEIKHEINPLRLKQLNRELNAKYKELKRGRK